MTRLPKAVQIINFSSDKKVMSAKYQVLLSSDSASNFQHSSEPAINIDTSHKDCKQQSSLPHQYGKLHYFLQKLAERRSSSLRRRVDVKYKAGKSVLQSGKSLDIAIERSFDELPETVNDTSQ